MNLKEYKFLFYIIILYLVFFVIKLPYVIKMPGGIINIDSKINSDLKIDTSGSFNMTYVSEVKATIPTFIISLFNDKWDIEKIDNDSISITEYRNKILLEEANNIAILNAYKSAEKKINIKKNNLIITYIDDKSKTNLKIKDEIQLVDNKKITNGDELKEIINQHNIGETIKIKTKNGIKKAEIYESGGKKIIGIMINNDYKLDSEFDFNFSNNEAGPSGGMMMTLAIYNYLTNDSLTNNRKIAGTGTIDINGNIGEIGGVKYKIIGAEKEKCDLFLVPYDNYKEALEIKNKNKYNINIVPVKKIEDVIKYLKE